MNDDLISRQAAIKATWQDTGYTDPFNVMTAIRDRIQQLPTAQPERTPMQELLDVTADRDYWKAQCHSYEMTINRLTESAQPERIRGRWTRDNACSECGCQPWFSGDIRNYNFCPNCGAEMEVTE